MACPAAISLHDAQRLHGSSVGPSAQFSPLARIRAIVVLPTPLGPQNKYAWPVRFILMAFCKVWTIGFWPITSLKTCGRNFRAMTWYFIVGSGTGDTVSHWMTCYRCFLPDLAGFAGSNCTAPLCLIRNGV